MQTVQFMLEEYRALCGEMQNRWTQQQQIMTIAWGIALGGGVLTLLSRPFTVLGPAVQSSDAAQVQNSITLWLLLTPLSLAILCGVFIRHDHKNMRILRYLYLRLRPQVRTVLGELTTNVWEWPEFEMQLVEWDLFWTNPWQFASRLVSEGCRYLIMITPCALMVLFLYSLLGDQLESKWLFKLTFRLDTIAVVACAVGTFITAFEFKGLLGVIKRGDGESHSLGSRAAGSSR